MSRTEPARDRAMHWPALIALSAAVFLSITLELLPSGLLPEMASGLGVTEAAMGVAVSVYALTVVVTSAPLVALTARMPRRGLLVAVLAVLAATTVATALAPNLPVLIGVRFVGGLAHGVFWSIVAAEASRLVPERLIGRAVSIVLGGGTLAIVLGVPAATIVGQALGWRAAFAIVGALAFTGALVVRLVVPARPTATAGVTATGSITHATASRFRFGDPGLAQVVLVCAVTAIVMLGQYAVFTYVAPMLTDLVGVGSSAVGPMLFLYGAAGAVGLVIAGSPLARRATGALVVAMVLVAASLAALALVPANLGVALASLAVWGAAFGMLPPLLQVRLLRAAPPSHRDAASALYTSGFNAGIGGGALVGAVVFDAFGVAALPWVYVLLLVAAGVLVVAGAVVARRRAVESVGGDVPGVDALGVDAHGVDGLGQDARGTVQVGTVQVGAGQPAEAVAQATGPVRPSTA
ncbi:MFS transporter [Agromyces sp. MMS24-K17]|uniref:MFS transporter n=1 Tax=Agromyces sp. MMS24-K17 TaxID=3372850 RepID=UPI0037553739